MNHRNIDYDALDPGIRRLVRLLRENGFDTVAKVGRDESALDVPNVTIMVKPDLLVTEADRLSALLERVTGRTVWPHIRDGEEMEPDPDWPMVQATYAPYSPALGGEGEASLHVFGVRDAWLDGGAA